MKRLGMGLAGLAVLGSMAFAGNGGVQGKSLSDYLRMYMDWALGGPQTDHHGSVTFLPLPAGEGPDEDGVYVGELDVTLKAKQSYFLPLFIFYGETYNDGTPDDDPDFPADSDFTDADVVLTVDGTTVIDSSVNDLSSYFVDTTYFTQPIEYAEPTWYHSDSAIWVKGLGFLQQPLSKGTHTMHLRITSDFLSDHFGFAGWDNTWNITVTK